jgi:hypothetical protein
MRSKVLLVGMLAAALAFAGCDDDEDDVEAFTATLSGANEVPAVRTTTGTGLATFELSGTTVSYTLEVESIENVTMAHIHSGAAAPHGPVRVFLFNGPITTVVGRRALSSGSFTEADLTGISFADLLNEMRAGTAYVNVHTTQFPTGEIRGQVALR